MIANLFGRAGLVLLLLLAPALAMAARPQPAPASEPLRLNGTLSVQIADDFQAHTARTIYSLVVRPGYRVPLEFAGSVPTGLRTGMKVRASGRFDGQRLRVDPQPEAFRIEAAETPAASAPAAARKVLTVLTDIVDGTGTVNRVDQSCDAADKTADIMFGTTTTLRNVDGAYRASSYDALGIGGAAYPGNGLDVLRVQVHEAALGLGGVCNYDDWANQADALVAAAGVAPGDFQHRMYVLPSTAGCGWAGLGELSCGTDCRAWVKPYEYYCGLRGAHAHELGHNLGLMHASSDWYNDGLNIDEYGDQSDFMGYAEDTVHQTSALHQFQLGWLGVVDLPGDGTFTLSPSSVNPAAHPQLFRLTPPNGLPYYFSYRMGVGYDEGVYGQPLSIHRWAGGPANTIYITTLSENDSFFDDANALVVTLQSKSADGAVFTVTRNGTCTRAAPTVGISPGSTTTTAVPANATYAVTVRNNDSNACGSSPFIVNGSVQPWLQSTSDGWKRIAPGATASFNFAVSANALTANGNYAIAVGTSDDGLHPVAQANASYVINVPATCVVRAPTGQLFPASQTTTQLPAGDIGFGAKITNNDSGSDCTESDFPLSVTVPADWSETHSPSTLTIPAVLSGSSNIHVSVPAGTPNGTYPITVATTAGGGHGAISFSGSVTVAVDPNACFRQGPLVVLNPSAVSTSTLPKSWSVALSVQNRDSGGGCVPSTFALSTYSEAGWAMSVSPTSLSVAPGATAQATLSFTAPAGAAWGNYQPLALVTDAAHGETRASELVQVLPSNTCTRSAPDVSLAPPSQTVNALPATRNYTITVTNKDSAACGGTNMFPLAATVPAGWTGKLSPVRLTLAPGASAAATLAVTPATSAANGSYAVAAATKADATHASASASGSLVVSVANTTDTTPPTVPGNLTGKLVSGQVALAWSASTDTGSGLANYKVYKNGALFATTTGTSLSKSIPRGTWTFRVTATDKAGNVSAASNSVVVTK